MKHRALNYIVTAVIVGITVAILASGSEVGIIAFIIEKTHKLYLMGGLLCLLLYWFLEALILQALFSLNGLESSFLRSLKLTMYGQYYNLITPFASGGQPVQIYVMSHDYGVPVGKATSITINKFMVYHFVVTVFALVMAVLYLDFIVKQALWAKAFIYIGLALNTLGIAAIFLLCYSSPVFEPLIRICLRLLHKIKLCRSLGLSALSAHMDEYRQSLFLFLSDKKAMILVTLYSLLQIMVYYSVTYFVYLAFELSGISYWQIVAIQSLLYMAVNFIPTPGYAGVSEGGFYLLYGLIFPSGLLIPAIFLWRFIVYYLNLAVAGCVVLLSFILKKVGARVSQT